MKYDVRLGLYCIKLVYVRVNGLNDEREKTHGR